MEDSNLQGDAAKLAEHLKKEYSDRLRAAEEANAELRSTIATQAERQTQFEEQLKSNSHHGMAYVEGADDAFDKTNHNPDTQFNLHRGMVGHAFGWDYDKTPYQKSTGDRKLWPERDIIEASTEKAQAAGVDVSGGFAVPEQFNSDYIPRLRAMSVAFNLGVQSRTDFRGSPVVWPRIDSDSQAYWVAENVAPTETDVELGQLSMTPHELAALIPISQRLMFQTSNAFEGMIRDHMARTHALKLDEAIFKGVGAAGQPLGIANLSGTGSVNFNGVDALSQATSTLAMSDALSAMEEQVDIQNALQGSLGYVAHPTAAHVMRKIKDADGMPILRSGDVNDRPTRKDLYGYAFETSTQLSAADGGDLIFGNWADAMVGQWGTLVIDTSDVAGNAFFRRQVYVRAVLTVDTAFMHPESFCLATEFDIPALAAL